MKRNRKEVTEKKEEAFKEPDEWTAVGFLEEFKRIHETMEDRSFAFILGAGASVSSNIPSGATLAERWVKELYHLKIGKGNEPSLKDWATEENLSIKGFSLERAASFYPQIYDRRFGDDPESGYAYLEDVMRAAEPNVGYSVIAQVLAKTRHKTIVTTNFDNLIADALSLYTDTFPLVCGHESLAGFVRPKLRRPLVAKIHRDLLLAPKNDVDGTSTLDEKWATVLKRLFDEFTPIVIGYGGNDGSLMGFLGKLDAGSIRGGLYWCYRFEDGRPEAYIRQVVAKHKGKLIPIIGFDEFMIQVGQVLGYELLDKQIEGEAKRTASRYREQFEKFQKNLERPTDNVEADNALKPVRAAFAETVKKEKSWWGWELKVTEERDPNKKEQLYREGLIEFPDSSELSGNFANFMKDVRKDYDEAETLYRKALELDPKNANNVGNFTKLKIEKRTLKEALTLIKKAFDANHVDGTVISEALELELWFYCYAVFFDEYKDADKKIEELLAKGVTSPGWNLKEVVVVARELNHPDFDKLCQFEKRITEGDSG